MEDSNRSIQMIAYELKHGECFQLYDGTDLLMVNCGSRSEEDKKRTNQIMDTFSKLYQNRHVLISGFRRDAYNRLFEYKEKEPYVDVLYLSNYCFSENNEVIKILRLLFLYAPKNSPQFELCRSLFDLLSLIPRIVVHPKNVVALQSNQYFYSASNKYDILGPKYMEDMCGLKFIGLLENLKEQYQETHPKEEQRWVDMYREMSTQVLDGGNRSHSRGVFTQFDHCYEELKHTRELREETMQSELVLDDFFLREEINQFLCFMNRGELIFHSNKVLFMDHHRDSLIGEDVRLQIKEQYKVIKFRKFDESLESSNLPIAKDYVISHTLDCGCDCSLPFIKQTSSKVYDNRGTKYFYDWKEKQVVCFSDPVHDLTFIL